MSFREFKLFYLLSCVGLGLIVLSPTLAVVIRIPVGERFSELWVLGPDHTAENYPFNVTANEVYKVYLGVGNHMGGLEHFRVYVKFRSQTEPLPNATDGTPSPLPPLYEYNVFLEDGKGWEAPLDFSFSGVSFVEDYCLVESIVINDVGFRVDKSVLWDAENRGFYYQLFIELWVYEVETGGFRFDNKFVSLWLNMTG